MSRTFKDVKSVKANIAEAAKKQKISHDHSLLGETVTKIYTGEYVFNCSKEDPKVLSYLKYLDSLPDTTYTVTENRKNSSYAAHTNFRVEHVEASSSKLQTKYCEGCEVIQRVETVVRHEKTRTTYYSQYCFDINYYDFETRKDTRDNGIVLCSPDIMSPSVRKYYCSCFYCSNYDENRDGGTRTHVKNTLRKTAVAYNSGCVEEYEKNTLL